ncbi:PACN1 protein, partial [Polyodon spathula]|nr:PACN1 protein [Polyodon spathula]
FLQPGNYQSTVNRVDDAYQACNDIIACFQDRAKIERQYAQQLTEWTAKWRPLVDAISPLSLSSLLSLLSLSSLSLLSSLSPLSLLSLSPLFSLSSLSPLSLSSLLSLLSLSSLSLLSSLSPLSLLSLSPLFSLSSLSPLSLSSLLSLLSLSSLSLLSSLSPLSLLSLLSQLRAHYEKVLEDASRYAPRYMEEMESVFEQSQQLEQKRISFLKQAFLSIHRHLDITNNER